MSSFDFAIEYRPDKKHGNTDGMSRCPAPQNCDCPECANLSELKCGPLEKCLRRAELMMSDLKLESNEVTNTILLGPLGNDGLLPHIVTK